MASLDACSRNMCSKTLVKEGMTYDVLKTVFQKCSSFMDFWQTLKNVGIERKVAKHFTSQFGALGLQNEGALGYCLDLAKQNGTPVSNGMDSQEHQQKHSSGNSFTANSNELNSQNIETSEQSSSSDIGPADSKGSSSQKNEFSKPSSSIKDIPNPNVPCSGNSIVTVRSVSSSQAFEQRPMDYALTSSSDEVRPRICDANGHGRGLKNSKKESKVISETEHSTNLTESGNSEESSKEDENENWDSEISNSGNNGTFVLKINDVIPVSVGIDDFSSDKSHSKRQKRNTCKDTDRSEKQVGKNFKTDVKSKHSSEANRKRNSNTEGIRSSVGESKVSKSTSLSEAHSIKNNSKTTIPDVKTTQNLDGRKTNHESSVGESKSKIIGNVKHETRDKNDNSHVQAISNTNAGQNSQDSIIKQSNLSIANESTKAKPPSLVMPENITEKISKSRNGEIGRNGEICNKNKQTQSKRKRNKQNSNQMKPVILLDLPGSPDFKGKDTTTFFVGDVEIRVPVEKREIERDVPLRDTCSADGRVSEHHDKSEPTEVKPELSKLCDTDRDNKRDDEGVKIPMTVEVLPLSHDEDTSLRYVERDGLDNASDTIKVEVSKNDDTLNSFENKDVKISDSLANGEVTGKDSKEMVETSKTEINDQNDSFGVLVKAHGEVQSPAKTRDSQNEEMSCTLDTSGSSNENQPGEDKASDMNNDGFPVESNLNVDEQQSEQQPLQAFDEIHDGNFPPSMYQPSMQPMPLRFTAPCPTGLPTGMPPAVPTGYGFYPPMGPMMPMYSGTPFVPFHGVPYPVHQGFVPFGGFQHRYPLPGHVFQQPAIYHQQEPENSSAYLGVHNVASPLNIHRESPDTLGIPCSEVGPTVPEKTSIKANVYDSFSTTSDETSESSSYLEHESFDHVSSSAIHSDSSKEDHRSGRRRPYERNYSKRHLKERNDQFRKVVHKGKEVKENKEDEDQSGDHNSRKMKESAGQSSSSLLTPPRASKTKSSKDLSVENGAKGKPSKEAHLNKPRSSSKSSDRESLSSEKPSSQRETNRSTSTRKSPSKGKEYKDSKRSEAITKKSDGSPKGSALKSSPEESVNIEVPSKELGPASKTSTNVVKSNSNSTPRSPSKASSVEGSPKNEDEPKRSSIKINENISPKSTRASIKQKPEDDTKYKKESKDITHEAKTSPSTSRHPNTEPSKPSPPRPSRSEFPKEKRSQNTSSHSQQREHYHSKSDDISLKHTTPKQPISKVSKLEVSPKSGDSGSERNYQTSKKSEDPSRKCTSSKSTREASTIKVEKSSDHGREMNRVYPPSKKGDNAPQKSVPPRQSNKVSSIKSSPKSSGSGSDAESKKKLYDSASSQTSNSSHRRDGSDPLSSSKPRLMEKPTTSMESKSIEKKSGDTKEPRQEVSLLTSKKSHTGSETKPSVPNTSAENQKSTKGNVADGVTSSLPNQNNEAARKLKWPLSAWSGGTIKAPPKPQRDPQARKKVRESQTKSSMSGTLSEESFKKTPSVISESHRDNSGNDRGVSGNSMNCSESHRNVSEVNQSHTSKKTKGTKEEGDLPDNNTLKDKAIEPRYNNTTAENKGKKEPEKSSSQTVNYRDILVGKTNPKTQCNTTSSAVEGSSTNGFQKDAKDYKKSNKSFGKPTENNNIDVHKFTTNSPVNTARSDNEWKDKKANSERHVSRDAKISKSHKHQSQR